MENNKPRILYLLHILMKYTDEKHPLTTNQIIEMLKNDYDISAYRTTLARDFKDLEEFGIDIICERSVQNKYFIGSRDINIAELKLLIDAVESSKFITEKKSTELVEKLQGLASVHSKDTLKRNIKAYSRFKPDHEDILYTADIVNRAINEGKKIEFDYYHYNVRKEKITSSDGKKYIFSPYYLIWDGDCYYMVGYSDKHQSIGSFRVDRVFGTPEILEDKAEPAPEDFDINEYIKTLFRMFNSERQEVELICDNDTMDAIIERFGIDVTTYANDMHSFRVVTNVAVSHIFYSWVFGFGGKVKIKAPEDVRNEYLEMVKAALDNA